MHIIYFNLLLTLLFTIPIHTKISISKLSPKISAVFQRSKTDITHHPFNNITKLDLTNHYGSVSIEPWKQSCVVIEVRTKGSKQFNQNVQLKTKLDNNALQAILQAAQQPKKGSIHIHILAPQDLPIKITTKDGLVSCKNHHGALHIKTDWGNIQIKDHNNSIQAESTQGHILVQQKNLGLGRSLHLQTDQGNITLKIPQSLEAPVQAHTQRGKISSTLFITLNHQTIQLNAETFKNSQHHIQGVIGQPGEQNKYGSIFMKTNYGMIDILAYNAI